MPLHPPTLLIAFGAILLLATGASGSLALKQQSRRGAHWWLASNAFLTAALIVQALADPEGPGAPIAAFFALQWPVVTLAGIRRFYSRGATRVPEWADRVALVVAALATIGTWLAPIDVATPAQVYAAASFGLTLYVAAAVSRLEDFATSSTLKTLRLGLVAGALVQATWLAVAIAFLGPVVGAADAALGAMLTMAAVALLMTQLALVMNHERRIAHLVASQRKLRHLVDVDTLTKLPNRRHFYELAERAVEAARDAATMIVFDVDRMSRVNELLGHTNGDEALRQIGTVLRETLRRRDVAGRLGGDDFAVVLPRTRLADSALVVSRIVSRLDDRQVAPRIMRVALNVGSIQMQPNETIAEALRRAEAALVARRAESRRGDTMPLAREPAPIALDDPASPSALMNLIPIGEVTQT
jgi:diguanylate cyclase (GGDEF)-like protein